MNAVLNAVVPVFGLIGIGALAARTGVLGPAVTDSLNRFVVYLPLPALLFLATARMRWADLDHPGFIAASLGSMAATFALSMALDRRRSHRLADRAIEGLDAAYGNTGYMGFPLGLALFGPALLPAIVISALLTTTLLFAAALVLIEFDLAAAPSLGRTLAVAARSLIRNPLIVSPAAGALMAATGIPLPVPADHFLTLLSSAAGPCALVTIGLFLAQEGIGGGEGGAVVVRLVGLKLLVQPLVTFAIARLVEMPPEWFACALVLSALPTGSGPFMLAKLYGRDAAATSRAILVSTLLSVVTVSLLVVWLGR